MFKNILFIALLFPLGLKAADSNFETITFPSTDGLEITADVYLVKDFNAPFILLFHQAGYSRGEYREIAPKLNQLGFNAMAIDQRSGRQINGVINATAQRATDQNIPHAHLDALVDLQAAIFYAKENYVKGKLIFLGSSYSSALVLKIMGDSPNIANAVLSFSPGEYFSNRTLIQDSAKNIQKPTFITSAKSEENSWRAIFDVIPATSKTFFLPKTAGVHGAKALWQSTPENESYWQATSNFLKQFNNTASPKTTCIATYSAINGKLKIPCVSAENNQFNVELQQQNDTIFKLLIDNIKMIAITDNKCMASYNANTQRLTLPCVQVNTDLFKVEFQQQLGSILFDLNANNIERVNE